MNVYTIDRVGGLAGVMTGVLLAAATPAGATVTVQGTLTLQSATQLALSGTTSQFTADYVLPSSGTLEVTLTDNRFISALRQLDFSLYSGGGSGVTLVSGPRSAAGASMTWDFDVGAGSYSTMFQVAANAMPGVSNFWVGQFSDTVLFTPVPPTPAVPLPPAGSVLLAGVGVLGAFTRRRVRKVPTTVAAAAAPTWSTSLKDTLLGGCVTMLSLLI